MTVPDGPVLKAQPFKQGSMLWLCIRALGVSLLLGLLLWRDGQGPAQLGLARAAIVATVWPALKHRLPLAAAHRARRLALLRLAPVISGSAALAIVAATFLRYEPRDTTEVPGLLLLSSAALSLTFGMAQVGSDEDIDAALKRAELALIEARRQGRSCAVAALGDEDQPSFSPSQPLGLTAC